MPGLNSSKMLEEVLSWRDLLKRIISVPQEKQRIAELMGVNPVTLTRWVKVKATPRLDGLLRLLGAVPPQVAAQLVDLMAREYPHYASAIEAFSKEAAPAIPSAFYTRVLNTYTTHHVGLRLDGIRIMILQQMLAHLAPTQQPLNIAIAQCMPPPLDQSKKVRSLRLLTGRATPYWKHFTEKSALFLGAESPLGRAMKFERHLIWQEAQDQDWLLAFYDVTKAGSFVARPITRGVRLCGCLLLFSTEANFFTPERLRLLHAYAELLTLGFLPEDYFSQDEIELGVMPVPLQQRPLMDEISLRITGHLQQAASEGSRMTLQQAEMIVWRELEDLMLRMG
jgi:hypothetical protein